MPRFGGQVSNIEDHLVEGDSEKEWYFQDPDSYLKYGNFLSMSDSQREKSEIEFIALDEGSLFSLFDLNGLIIELAEGKEKDKEN